MKFIKTYFWPVFSVMFITLLVGVIGWQNFIPNTWFTGWDNLHPEFDFWLNISRDFSSTWKEFQGLGAVSGVALSADLPRRLVLWLMSLVIPAQQLRFVMVLLLLWLGPLGVYFFLRNFVFNNFSKKNLEIGAFLGAVFYLLNFITLQQFFVPFETFIAQYAALPWLVLSLSGFIKSPDWQRFSWLVLVLIFITPIAYVPTIFIVTFLVLLIFLVAQFFEIKKIPKIYIKKRLIKRYLISLLVFFLVSIAINAHWLFPFGYYVLNKGEATANSMINRFASMDAKLANQEYGRWSDVFLLRGFLFEYVDTSVDGQGEFLLEVWRQHFAQWWVVAASLIVFVFILLGVFVARIRRVKYFGFFLSIFLLSVFMLKSYNPPFGFLFSFFSDKLPFFAEVFRYTFTKWATVAIFAYSYFFALGILAIIRFFKFLFGTKYVFETITILLSIILLLIPIKPMFEGQLFSKSNHLEIPKEYFEVMNYFSTKPDQARIATLPQYSFWGWDVHDWGYRGSGFWRHGVDQPVLERTHDVWANENEQYYFEIKEAILSQNARLLASVLDKYRVGWLLIDKSLSYSDENNIEQIYQLADQTGLFLQPIVFGDLTIYERKNITEYANSFITAENLLQTAEHPQVSHDIVHYYNGPYFSGQTPQILYPFHLSNSQLTEINNNSSDTFSINKEISTQNKNQPDTKINKFVIPSFFELESIVPVEIFAKIDTHLTIYFRPQIPQILVNDIPIDQFDLSQKIILDLDNSTYDFFLQLNDNHLIDFSINEMDKNKIIQIGSGYANTKLSNTIKLYSANPIAQFDISEGFSTSGTTDCSGKGSGDYFIEKSVSEFSLVGKNATPCSSVDIEVESQPSLFEILLETKSTQSEILIVLLKDKILDKEIGFRINNLTHGKDWHYGKAYALDEDGSVKILRAILALEADQETRSIAMKNIQFSQYSLLDKGEFKLVTQDSRSINFDQPIKSIQAHIKVPKVDPAIFYTPSSHQFFEHTNNCDQFNFGEHSKKISNEITQYKSTNASECETWNLKQLENNSNYLLNIRTRHISGKPIQICLGQVSTNYCQMVDLLSIENSWQSQKFRIKTTQASKVGNNNQSYVLKVINNSIGRIISENELSNIDIFPFPFSWLGEVKLSSDQKVNKPLAKVKTKKLSSSLYEVSFDSAKKPNELVLWQTYDEGWVAFEVSGPVQINSIVLNLWQMTRPLKSHVRVSGWANGWDLDEASKTIIMVVFWPQVFQEIAWVVLLVLLVALPIGFIKKFIFSVIRKKR